MIYVLVELRSSEGLIELFRHECPEPVYDMQRKYIELNPKGIFTVMEGV